MPQRLTVRAPRGRGYPAWAQAYRPFANRTMAVPYALAAAFFAPVSGV